MTAEKKRLVYFEEWMDPIGPEIIGRDANIELVRLEQDADEDSVWEALSTAHGYQMRASTETQKKFWPGPEFLARCPNLLAVSSAGAGYDMADVAACTDAGIIVCNQTGSNAESVAQHVFGMMLALCKQMIQSDRAIRREPRGWNRWDYMGHELTGRSIGIVGLGNIGRRVAQISKVFNMTAYAYDPYLTDADFAERNAERVSSLEELFSKVDFISINCPLTDETNGMINGDLYARMKPTAIFITTARGYIHDEVALTEAIKEGRIAAAGCDVFELEPPAHDHPLMAFDNVIVSPHNAGITSDASYNMAAYAAEQWSDIFAGKVPPRLRNPEAWDRYRARFQALLGTEPQAA
jgi:D-3-phosphoglycerate dehydrogenase